MPRISDDILDCVIYLYPTELDARNGEKVGGSGFLVAIPSKVFENAHYIYAVTNSHVIREGNSPVVRLNTKEGTMDVLNLETDDWLHHPDGDDVAVCPIALPLDYFKFKFVGQEMFLTEDVIKEHAIGAGDDVFLVGRFINHEGKQRNIPSVRFGNIAMMPWEPIRHPTRGILMESYLIEARSIAGYSGSPVFAHILPMSLRPHHNRMDTRYRVWLLGVDWGHIPVKEVVKEKAGNEVSEGWWVEYNAGMMGVVPVWKLAELLELEPLKTGREENEEKLAKEKERES